MGVPVLRHHRRSDAAAVEVMGGLFRDPQCLADLGPRSAGRACGFDDVSAPCRQQIDGLRVRTKRLQRCNFPYLGKDLCCSDPRLVVAGGRDFAPGLAAVEVFPHSEQLMDITAVAGKLEIVRRERAKGRTAQEAAQLVGRSRATLYRYQKAKTSLGS
ncbi:hypothetical protein [Arthrobacter sp. StoSoilB13]|uniref:hypothetical protein n=1 Tax=Arthrobacter sp. StoSoilB13 TaxID=2830993 RepID=UPI001CC624E4|nr:hypothetical protein [Arthrobacter sp. StoSoilB13]